MSNGGLVGVRRRLPYARGAGGCPQPVTHLNVGSVVWGDMRLPNVFQRGNRPPKPLHTVYQGVQREGCAKSDCYTETMKEIELERTFLAKELPPNLGTSPQKQMLDIYLPSTADHPTLRIRKIGDKREITKKEPVSMGDRTILEEHTIPLREDEYIELSQVPGKRVQKTRYYYTENGRVYEIGVFEEDLKGLVLIDVEFKSVEDMRAFTPPAWILAELKETNFLAGGVLCGKKYSDIENKLTEYGYSRIG